MPPGNAGSRRLKRQCRREDERETEVDVCFDIAARNEKTAVVRVTSFGRESRDDHRVLFAEKT